MRVPLRTISPVAPSAVDGARSTRFLRRDGPVIVWSMSDNRQEQSARASQALAKKGRWALLGVVFLGIAALLAAKPYLPGALFHNFANIDDYKIFPQRIVKASLPGLPWKVSAVQNAGPPPDLEKLLARLNTTALLMIENNQIVYEKYFLEGGENEISGSFSAAKSIVGILIGFAIQEHFIKSLDEPIATYIPEWAAEPMGKITIKNLLTMSSGLDWNESYRNPLSSMAEGYYGSRLLKTTLRQRPARAPGVRYEYQSGATELLGLVLARATQRTLAQYASEKLWIPLGAERDAVWSLDAEGGIEKAYCCLNARARDFARIGQFLLNDGKWPDAAGTPQQLLNSDFLREMATPHGIPDEMGKPVDFYGYQLWILSTPRGPVKYARGILGQYIIAVPQTHRVLVRLGKKRGNTVDHHPEEVRAMVDWALR
jgi:CubicO group peptidase (beta-lactamase class C family)